MEQNKTIGTTPKNKSQAELLAEAEYPYDGGAFHRPRFDDDLQRAAFAKGYAAGQAAQWISVEDRLPDNEQLVDIMQDLPPIGSMRITGCIYIRSAFHDGHARNAYGHRRMDVTHWMPIPIPPTK